MVRIIVYVMLAALILIGGATLGWYFLANQVDVRLTQQIAQMAEQDKIVECKNQRVEGFPFRIGVFCDGISYEHKAEQVFFKAGNLRSAAQFYQLGLVVGELDGPADIKTPGLTDLQLGWKLARASSRLSLDGPKRISVTIDAPKLSAVDRSEKNTPLADMARLELHLRPRNGDANSPDIEVAIDSKALKIATISKDILPPLAFKLKAAISQMNKVLKSRQDLGVWIKEHGVAAQIDAFEVVLEGGSSLLAMGPITIDKAGLVSGKLDIELSDVAFIADKITRQFPQFKDTADIIKTTSLLLTQASTNGKVKMKVAIKRGVISMGPIPLGFIPALF